MRCYHLCNMYLSSIQQGIQSAHSQMELFVKYRKNSAQKEKLYNWAENHKTMIVLNGGYMETMNSALDFFKNEENPYPYAYFKESPEALGGILTNIAIVLPEKIYVTSELMRKKLIDINLDVDTRLPMELVDETEETLAIFGEFSNFEIELCSFMNNFRLAN